MTKILKLVENSVITITTILDSRLVFHGFKSVFKVFHGFRLVFHGYRWVYMFFFAAPGFSLFQIGFHGFRMVFKVF